ncbi:biotin--[acetyl-CoA-carboxylase] ligase [Bartonella sp. HY038]|uniref:biotin--[acetyl-CoA-carboxylase] ligase n=1 Tax=Bartonella sp. HY038 TaxID=2759660 RepID=UPI0015FA1983|nr:biotin--[acetyl-CoA-carboxylase] ligase [Bartonella sp. HY038]
MVVRLSSQAKKAGYRVEFYELLDSTNQLATEFAKNGDQGKLWIVADEQLAGRGRRGRQWVSPKGNFFVSLLLVDDFAPHNAATLGFVTGVSLIEALEQHKRSIGFGIFNEPVKLKWPNDLLVGDAKLSGILLELVTLPNQNHAIIIGIGGNIVSSPDNMPYPTAALHNIGYNIDAAQWFESLSDTWATNYKLWDKGKNLSAIRDKWLQHAANLGGRVNIMVNGELITGVFETIDENCQLVIYQDNGVRKTISAGEVHFTNQVFSAKQ